VFCPSEIETIETTLLYAPSTLERIHICDVGRSLIKVFGSKELVSV
jgi:hypothetical protein